MAWRPFRAWERPPADHSQVARTRVHRQGTAGLITDPGGAEMNTFDIFRLNSDRSFSWISSADSLYTVLKTITSRPGDSSEEFLIYDHGTNEKIRFRATTSTMAFGLCDIRPVALQGDQSPSWNNR